MIWDQQNLLLETDTSNAIQARYTDFPGYWGGLTSQNRSGTSSFYGYDSQGSVRILTNSAGAVTDTYVYTAFGVELLNGSGTINPFRYVGLYGYYMTFINLYYVRARWLDAVKGRWDSRDPIGFEGGDVYDYIYGSNDIASDIDPSGLQSRKQSAIDQLKSLGLAGAATATTNPCCATCASAIRQFWMGDTTIGTIETDEQEKKSHRKHVVPIGGQPALHACNAGYAHCMACCVLTRVAGQQCALLMQLSQDTRYHAGQSKSNSRLDQCAAGVAASATGNCHAACSLKYNNWIINTPFNSNSLPCRKLQNQRKSIPTNPNLGFPPLIGCLKMT